METINMAQFANSLLGTIKAVQQIEKISEDICPECYTNMELISEDGFTVPGPDRDCEPEFVRTAVTYHCPECGEVVKLEKGNFEIYQ